MYRPNLRLLSERRLRLANSSPDMKALFNAPAYIYIWRPWKLLRRLGGLGMQSRAGRGWVRLQEIRIWIIGRRGYQRRPLSLAEISPRK